MNGLVIGTLLLATAVSAAVGTHDRNPYLCGIAAICFSVFLYLILK